MSTRARAVRLSLPLATVALAAACSSPQIADPHGSPAGPTTSSTAQSPSPDRSSDAASPPAPVASDEPAAATGQPNSPRIEFRLGEESLTGTLLGTPAGRDLLAQLPLTLTMRDFGSVEKVAGLPAPLSTTGAPPGADPAVGDIGYYAPWNNLVLYYGDQDYHDGIVRLGTLDGDVDVIGQQTGDLSVSVQHVTD